MFKSSGAAPDLEFDVTNADAESALTLRPAATPQLPAPTLYQLRVTALSAKALTITVMVSPAAAPKIPQTVEGEHRYANVAPSEEEVAAILEAFRALDSDPVKDLDKDFKAADRRKLEPFEILRGYVEEIQMAMNMPPDQIDGVLGAQETRPKIKALNNGNEKLTKDFVAAILATPKFTAPHEPVADTKLEGSLRANGEVLKEFATAIGLPEADLADNTKVRAKINEKRAELKLPQSGTVTRLFLRLAAPELAKKVIVPEAPPKQS